MSLWTDNRSVRVGDVIGGAGGDWRTANDSDRERARSVVSEYARADGRTSSALAAFYACPEHVIRNARWLAIAAGLLNKRRDRWTVTPAGRREICE